MLSDIENILKMLYSFRKVYIFCHLYTYFLEGNYLITSLTFLFATRKDVRKNRNIEKPIVVMMM